MKFAFCTKKAETLRKNIICAVIVLLSVFMFASSGFCKQGAERGISFCKSILVPSLFPFSVISSMISYAQLEGKLQKYINKLTQFLFFLPGQCWPAILAGLTGGYPCGAVAVQSLKKSGCITSEEMNRIMCFCVNSGPSFMINIAGMCMYGGHYAGVALFAIQTAVSMCIGAILGIRARITANNSSENSRSESQPAPPVAGFTEILVKSCNSAAYSMISMCAFIIFFCVTISLMQHYSIIDFLLKPFMSAGLFFDYAKIILISFFEITSGCAELSAGHAPMWLMAWITSYAGICVHFQIKSIITDKNFNFLKFVLYRFIAAFVTSLLAFFVSRFNLIAEETALASIKTQYSVKTFSASRHGSVMLIILCMYFIADSNISFFKHIPKKIKKAAQKTNNPR